MGIGAFGSAPRLLVWLVGGVRVIWLFRVPLASGLPSGSLGRNKERSSVGQHRKEYVETYDTLDSMGFSHAPGDISCPLWRRKCFLIATPRERETGREGAVGRGRGGEREVGTVLSTFLVDDVNVA